MYFKIYFTTGRKREQTQCEMLVSNAPLVDYDDEAEFQELLRGVVAAYSRVLNRVVDGQVNSRGHPKSPFAWSPVEEMAMGVALFPELLADGLVVVLRLTKQRGLRFAVALNAAIVLAVTTACRTYCNVMNDRLYCGCYRATTGQYPAILDDVSVGFVKAYMKQAMVLALGEVRDPQSFVHALHRRCFGCMLQPYGRHRTPRVFIPRHKIPEYVLAFASMTHARLGGKAAGQQLDADVLRLIVRMIDFH